MMASMVHSISLAGLVILMYMLGLYIVALIRQDNSVADIGWGLGCILAALAVLWWDGWVGGRQLIVTVLVMVWGVRLALHIFLRNWGRPEDFRYARHRLQDSVPQFFHTFWRVFVAQGFLMLVVLLPVLAILTATDGAMGWLDWVGVGVWVVGFLMEAVADMQLTRFVRHHGPGRVLDSGLWRYSRHPNYFGEALQWWGIWLMAVSVPAGWLTVVGPLVLTLMLVKVSGIPLVEGKRAGDPDYRRYMQRTNMFVPWFPKAGK